MRAINPLLMNDWPIKKFLAAVIAVMLALWALIAMGATGLETPILRPAVALVFLAFIPGIIILRILKLHELGSSETLLYSIGLGLAFVMSSGAFMNAVYPFFGISSPISLMPLMISFTTLISVLCVIAFVRDRNFSAPAHFDALGLLSPPVLFLLLLPALSALGTRLVYLHQGNTVLLILLPLIALTATLVAFSKFIPNKLYPLAIVAISISLIWHWSLVGDGLTGVDVHQEYYVQDLVLSNSIWDHSMPRTANATGTVNAMLSIVMLAPIFSLILNLDTVWIFKIFYPLFFSLVPLALFQAYRKQTGSKIAFLATFFFMSMPVFFSTMIQLVRQQIAELFLALSILLFVNLSKEIATTKKMTLLVIFGLSIVVSHYGLSYIYMLYLLIALPLLILWRSTTVNDLWGRIAKRFSKSSGTGVRRPGQPLTQSTPTATYATYVMLFVVASFAWYMYVSSGRTFTTIAEVIDQISSTLITDFFRLGTRGELTVQALGLMPMRSPEIEWEIARIFQYLAQLFILVGILGLIASWRKTRFHPVYAVLSLANMGILAISLIIPHFANRLGISRVYHMTLLFLAPFCILGGIAVFRWLSHRLNLHRLQSDRTFLKLIVVSLLVPYFLFTTGFIFELSGAAATSMPLSLYKVDWNIVTEPETLAARWLANTGEDNFAFYGDDYGRWTLFQEIEDRATRLPFDAGHISLPSYIFLRPWNVVQGEIYLLRMEGARSFQEWVDIAGETDMGNALREKSKIYDNGSAQVLGPM